MKTFINTKYLWLPLVYSSKQFVTENQPQQRMKIDNPIYVLQPHGLKNCCRDIYYITDKVSAQLIKSDQILLVLRTPRVVAPPSYLCFTINRHHEYLCFRVVYFKSCKWKFRYVIFVWTWVVELVCFNLIKIYKRIYSSAHIYNKFAATYSTLTCNLSNPDLLLGKAITLLFNESNVTRSYNKLVLIIITIISLRERDEVKLHCSWIILFFFFWFWLLQVLDCSVNDVCSLNRLEIIQFRGALAL